jgi:hypothetical protein
VKLPHVVNAVVPENKITRYLLNTEYRKGGRDKAIFFMRFAFLLINQQYSEMLCLAMPTHMKWLQSSGDPKPIYTSWKARLKHRVVVDR